MDFLDYKLTTTLPNTFPNKKLIANTINPHSFCIAKEDLLFQQALINSDILVPDGIGVIWANKFLNGKSIVKISGFDMHLHFLRLLNRQNNGKVFYLGSSESTLTKLQARVNREFPNIEVFVYSPPYKVGFTKEENQQIIKEINGFSPDLLFVGMTAPKQEKWVFENKDNLNSKLICSIGAVFDFYAGTVKRPNQLWINLGLEWLPRFLKEPRRLWRRNLISTPHFIFEIILQKFR
jgi:N-acetylglucosaminyldiphosphoundecaprenol N-acetyl-beta-D-mannosaminyltransferase